MADPLGPNGFLARRCRSFACAGRGLWRALAGQVHGRIHLLAAALVVALALTLEVSAGEWCALVLAITAVIAAETFNSALEQLADALHPAQHEGVGRAKDMAAGAVVAAALGALVVGAVVLGPKLVGC